MYAVWAVAALICRFYYSEATTQQCTNYICGAKLPNCKRLSTRKMCRICVIHFLSSTRKDPFLWLKRNSIKETDNLFLFSFCLRYKTVSLVRHRVCPEYESNVVWKKHDMVIHLLTSMDRGLTNWFPRVLEKETRIKGSGTHLVTDK